jgi:hypothetical protein
MAKAYQRAATRQRNSRANSRPTLRPPPSRHVSQSATNAGAKTPT